MIRWLQSIIDRLRGKHRRKPPAWGDGVDPARAGANAARAIDKIRRATHPGVTDQSGRSQQLVPGHDKQHGQWAIWSPQHGAWIGGYYIPPTRVCVTICNPADKGDYLDSTMEHETAHDVEYALLSIAPPWHYHRWSGLFRNWRNFPAQTVKPPPHRVCYLPHVEEGDLVELDFVDGGGLCCIATRDGYETMA